MRAATITWTTVILLAFAPAGASERVLRLDPQSTKVTFTLKATAHKIHGTLQLTDGEVRFDDETGWASGEINVDARLAQTGNTKRDRNMHGKVLQSELYPLLRFEPSRIVGRVANEGQSEIQLEGRLSIHGGEHPLTIRADVEIVDGRFSATTSFPVPYVEWGLRDPSVFLLRVAKVVEVTLAVEGTLADAPGGAN